MARHSKLGCRFYFVKKMMLKASYYLSVLFLAILPLLTKNYGGASSHDKRTKDAIKRGNSSVFI